MSSIKCGRCGGRHESVTDVRACYNGEAPARTAETAPRAELATEKQVKFLGSLLGRAGAYLGDGRQLDQIGRREISRLIEGMLEYLNKGKPLPVEAVLRKADPFAGIPNTDGSEDYRPSREVQNREPLPNVPAGHYATKSATGNNDLDFWRVDRPEEGRWAGRTFVKRVIGGRPSVPVRGSSAREALAAIDAAGAESAAVRYGQEIGRCYRCNRHLTDETSRSLGIGPDCRSAR